MTDYDYDMAPREIHHYVTAKGRTKLIDMLTEADLIDMLAVKRTQRLLDDDSGAPTWVDARAMYPRMLEKWEEATADLVAGDLAALLQFEDHPGVFAGSADYGPPHAFDWHAEEQDLIAAAIEEDEIARLEGER